MPESNVHRLKQLFSNPGLEWIRRRLRERLEHGKGLQGTIYHPNPKDDEVNAFNTLTGSPSRSRKGLSLPLEQLEEILQQGELADDLEEAILLLEGPITNRKNEREKQQDAWTQLFAEASERSRDTPFICEWIGSIRSNGLLKRLSKNDLRLAQTLLEQATTLFRRLPATTIPLPQFAAEISGDSHSLDFGAPLSGLVMQGVARLGCNRGWQTPVERRDAWNSVGVLCDSLSQPVLIHNLRLNHSHPLSDLLENGYSTQEPIYLTTRQLIRFPIDLEKDCLFDKVFVCENPSIVSAAAESYGNTSSPLICVSGNLTSSAQTLLKQLANSRIKIYYHGDFDWPGIAITNFVCDRYQAIPWRMSAQDYLSAHKEKPLTGKPLGTPWDPSLSQAMQKIKKIVYEEQVIDKLLKDLTG
ncbi:MAG: TIGR02679 family protein [Verrucomicrobiota bacterium]